MIDYYQREEKHHVYKLKFPNQHNKYFCGGTKFMQLICRSKLFVVKTIPQKDVVNCHHNYIPHQEMDFTEDNISQY